MASFIIISAEERTHSLVDSIVACCPPNEHILASPGKIIKNPDDDSFTYKYTIVGATDDDQERETTTLQNLLAQQFAFITGADPLPDGTLLNVFFLQNPLTEEEAGLERGWIEEIRSTYGFGDGQFTNFRLWRILLTFDPKHPQDIAKGIKKENINQIITDHRNNKTRFRQDLLYFSAQNTQGGAVFRDRNDYNLLMPRLLFDFILLAIDSNINIDPYIAPAYVNTNCFSIGYAERMYYLEDVIRFFKLADRRALLEQVMNGKDAAIDKEDKEAMDIEQCPFGLNQRKERLSQIYESIDYSEDIDSHEKTADWKIDDCIKKLYDAFNQKHDKEKGEVLHPKEEDIKTEIEDLNAKLTSAAEEDKEGLQKAIELKQKELERLRADFAKNHPDPISRKDIYKLKEKHHSEEALHPEEFNEEKAEEVENKLIEKYCALIEEAKSKEFDNFVQTLDTAATPTIPASSNIQPQTSEQNSGCFPFSWLFGNGGRDEDAGEQQQAAVPPPAPAAPSLSETVKTLIKTCQCKEKWKEFQGRCKQEDEKLQETYNDYNDFKPTTHSHHPEASLIDVERLKLEYEKIKEGHINDIINKWTATDNRTLQSLLELAEKEAEDYAKCNYTAVDWGEPYPFVKTCLSDNNTQNLKRYSLPFAYYNIRGGAAPIDTTKCLYSDNQHWITPATGSETHTPGIVSKICMFQFLAMNKAIIDSICANNEPVPFPIADTGHMPPPSAGASTDRQATDAEVTNTSPAADGEAPVMDWGGEE